jgi:hypothetical protein
LFLKNATTNVEATKQPKQQNKPKQRKNLEIFPLMIFIQGLHTGLLDVD